jgi:hypothetical protein
MSSNDRTKTIPLYINSEDRDPDLSSSESDFVISFHKTLRNVRRIDISSVEIPHSWYNIDENNNTVMAIATIFGNDIFTSTTVDTGEYTVEALRLEMQTVLNNLGLGTWTVTFDEPTYKFTITAAGLPFTFRILNSGSLNTILGFNNPPSNFDSTVTSDSIVDTQPHRFLFIKSNTLANNINTSYVSSFNKAWIIQDGVNDQFAVTTASGTFTWTMPVKGSFTVEQIVEIMQANLTIGAGLAGTTNWTVSLDRPSKIVTITSDTPFYVDSADTLATFAFNWRTNSTTLATSHTGRRIDFSMHQNVVRKVLVANTKFATEKVYDFRQFEQENDYGKNFDINSVDFQIVDSHDRLLNLNGKGISFTLLVSSNN